MYGKNIFFMEIFNEILKVNEKEIMIVYDKNGVIWFGLRDIIKVLGYNNIDRAISKIAISKQNRIIFNKIMPCSRLQGRIFIKPNKIFINEEGLYELLSKSTKPLAKVFMDKFFTEVMPELRKNGKYILNSDDMINLKEMNKNLKIENKDLKNNIRNIVYPKGKSLYVIIKIKNNKRYYKVGYTKDLNKRLKVYNTSFPNKIFFNYFVMVTSKKIDKCIKNIMKNEEFIKNKEYYKTSLKKIIKFIKACSKKIKEICCGYCLKCYRLSKITIHRCSLM